MKYILFVLLLLSIGTHAQVAYLQYPVRSSLHNANNEYDLPFPAIKRTLFQRNSGMILGLQKGRNTFVELGGEAHWRKISLLKPHIIGATANLEYNFSNNMLGYKAGMWMKRGRINLTYGANISYYTDFNERQRFGFGPSVGFRLLGFHLVNGYNFLTTNNVKPGQAQVEANPLYMSLRYYFPVKNNFTWDRKTMQKKKERKKERAKRIKEREKSKEKNDSENKGLFDVFKKKQEPTEVKNEGEKKGLFDVFKKKQDQTEVKSESEKKNLFDVFKKKQQ